MRTHLGSLMNQQAHSLERFKEAPSYKYSDPATGTLTNAEAERIESTFEGLKIAESPYETGYNPKTGKYQAHIDKRAMRQSSDSENSDFYDAADSTYKWSITTQAGKVVPVDQRDGEAHISYTGTPTEPAFLDFSPEDYANAPYDPDKTPWLGKPSGEASALFRHGHRNADGTALNSGMLGTGYTDGTIGINRHNASDEREFTYEIVNKGMTHRNGLLDLTWGDLSERRMVTQRLGVQDTAHPPLEHPAPGTKFRSQDGTEYEVTEEQHHRSHDFIDWLLSNRTLAESSLDHLGAHPQARIKIPIDSQWGRELAESLELDPDLGTENIDEDPTRSMIDVPFSDLPPQARISYINSWKFWHGIGAALETPDMFRRIRLDGTQAQQFANLPTGPDHNMLSLLHPPFPNFYMEFTAPVVFEHLDHYRVDRPGKSHEVVALLYRQADDEYLRDSKSEAGSITLFLRDRKTSAVSDCTFILSLTDGLAFTKYDMTQDTHDPSVIPDSYWDDIDTVLKSGSPPHHLKWAINGINEEKWIVVDPKDSDPGRYAGTWERTLNKYTEFFCHIILYTVAKGIEIVVEDVPRSERRRMERLRQKGEWPEPWQIVRVEPSLIKKYEDRQASHNGTTAHGYRYDVRGHMRKGKHKLRDGSYRYTVEWVPAHQRGLKHELYIPKVHQYAGEMDDKFIPEED